MRVGDIMEWVAAALFATAAYLATHHVWPALVVAGLCLVYFAQGYATDALPRLRQRKADS